MKKIIFIVLVFITSISLMSCTGKNHNYFFTGSFEGELCRMEVLEISEEEYDSFNGINVVQDKSDSEYKGKYYSICFSYFDETSNNYVQAVFENLTYTYRTTAEPCIYYDDKNNSIQPESTSQK